MVGGFLGRLLASLFVGICAALGVGPDEWASFVITGVPQWITPELARMAFLVSGTVTFILLVLPIVSSGTRKKEGRAQGKASSIEFDLEPEAFRLLNFLYKVQTRFDLHKMVIGRNGILAAHTNEIPSDVNLIAEFFSLVTSDASSEQAFEKLILKIPISYLRNIPETRLNNPYVLSVTTEGLAYVRSHSN